MAVSYKIMLCLFRMHNLLCDNCHSHVARALNLMQYSNSTRWNMVSLCLLMLVRGRYVSWGAVLRTWLPATVLAAVATALILSTHLSY